MREGLQRSLRPLAGFLVITMNLANLTNLLHEMGSCESITLSALGPPPLWSGALRQSANERACCAWVEIIQDVVVYLSRRERKFVKSLKLQSIHYIRTL